MKKSVKLIALILALVSVLALSGVIALAAEVPAETAAEAITAEAEAPVQEIAEADVPAAAADETAGEKTDGITKTKAIVAGALIAVVAGIGAISMALAINGASKGIARQPEAAGNIRTNVMLGLVFIETAIIYALIIAILVIFVL